FRVLTNRPASAMVAPTFVWFLTSAARNSRQNVDSIAISDRIGKLVPIRDLLVVDEDVDVPSQTPRIVEHEPVQTRVQADQVIDRLARARTRHGNHRRRLDMNTQTSRQMYFDAHHRLSEPVRA
ncbi:MAG: hypothetical protein OXG42_07690, partial [Chloroflexi bacterium]|nr:hypothetical protein [Chloroflexota bacterium]